MRLATLIVLSLAAPAAAAGEVAGVVTLDGQPLADATVTFHPADKDQKPVAGRSGADGKYRVAGVPAGACAVTVTRLLPDKKDPAKSRNVVAVRYADPKTSDIKVDVKPGKQGFDISLASR